MSLSTLPMTEALTQYIRETTVRESPALRKLREATASHPNAEFQIAPEQGRFMALLARLVGARRALEVGTFTGYSAMWVASALPDDGKLIACDINKEWTDIAREHWQAAGLADKIELRLGPALETLERMLAAGEAETFDIAFIDADKPGYDAYYERALALLRVGGLMMLDNVFRDGKVTDPDCTEEGTVAIRALNEKIGGDPRVDIAMVPIADGLLLARKRGMSEPEGADMYT